MLAFPIAGVTARVVLTAWWFSLATFGAATYGSVCRAYYLIDERYYGDGAQDLARRYRERLAADIQATSGCMTFGVAGGAVQLMLGRIHLQRLMIPDPSPAAVAAVMAAVVAALLIVALAKHGSTSKMLRMGLANPAAAARRPASAESIGDRLHDGRGLDY